MQEGPEVGCGTREDKACVHNRFGEDTLKDDPSVIEVEVKVGVGYRKKKPDAQGGCPPPDCGKRQKQGEAG